MTKRMGEFAAALPAMSNDDLLAAHAAVRREVRLFCDAESKHPDRGFIKTRRLAIELQMKQRGLI